VQSAADNKALHEQGAATNSEGMAAFVMLGFIFVITQIIGIYAGYKYGFGGKESKEAYRLTQGLSTYDGLILRIEPVIQIARASLQRLQQKMSGTHSDAGQGLCKTFDDYLIEERTSNLGGIHAHTVVQPSSITNNPLIQAVAAINPVVEQKPQSTMPSIADHVAKVEAMGRARIDKITLPHCPPMFLARYSKCAKPTKKRRRRCQTSRRIIKRG